ARQKCRKNCSQGIPERTIARNGTFLRWHCFTTSLQPSIPTAAERLVGNRQIKNKGQMKFIDRLLQEPSYGWKDGNGKAVQPSAAEIFRELLSRVNVFKSKKNWISAIGWFWVLCMLPFFFVFVFRYLSWWTFLAFIVYAMIV